MAVVEGAALNARARMYAEQAIESINIHVVSSDAMEAITAALATAFADGYAARGDDIAPNRALVDRRRRGRGGK